MKIPLGNLVSIKKGKKPTTTLSTSTESSFPLILTPNLRGLPYTEYCQEFSGQVIAKPQDILISWDGSVGRTGFGLEGCVGSTLARISVNDEETTHPEYLWCFLRSMETLIRKNSKGASIPHVDPTYLSRILVPLPDLGTQKEIAATFRALNDLDVKNGKQTKLLDEYISALFDVAFSGDIEETALSNVCNLITDGTHQSPQWAPSGVPFLFVSNITSGEIDLETSKFVSESSWQQLFAGKPVELGDILYSTVGSYGVPAEVRTEAKFAFQRHIAHLKLDKAKVNPTFMTEQMRTPAIKRQADKEVRGAAQPTLNLSAIRKFQVKVPSLSAQEAFASQVDVVRNLRLKTAYLAQLLHDAKQVLEFQYFGRS